MGLSLKSIGRGIKKVGKKIGKAWEKVDDFVLPAVGFALGGPGGAALGSAAARGIGDGKFDAKATLMAGAKGYAGGQLASVGGIQGGQGMGAMLSSGKSALMNPGATASKFMGGGSAASGGGAAGGAAGGTAGGAAGGTAGGAAGGTAGGAAGGTAGGAAGSAGGWGSKLKSVDNFVKDNSDLIMAGAGMVQGARQQGKADKLNQQALDLANRYYAETASLRAGAIDRLTNTQRPDLSGIYAGSSNSFARPLRPLSPVMGGETPPGPQAEDPTERPYREVTMPLPSVGGRRRFA